MRYKIKLVSFIFLIVMLVVGTLSIPVVSAADDDPTTMRYQACVTVKAGLRIRKTASNRGAIVTVIPRDGQVTYYPAKAKGAWDYVKYTVGRKTYYGYCGSKYLAKLATAASATIFFDYDVTVYADKKLTEPVGTIRNGSVYNQVGTDEYVGTKTVRVGRKVSKIDYSAIPVKFGRHYGFVNSTSSGMNPVVATNLKKIKAKKRVYMRDEWGQKTGGYVEKGDVYYSMLENGTTKLNAYYFRGIWNFFY